jgi:hypothetical protein
MRPVKNEVPSYTILWPIGTRIRWVFDGRPDGGTEVGIVSGYDTCYSTDCDDCDHRTYRLEGAASSRCHYRKPNSVFGLGYWKKED